MPAHRFLWPPEQGGVGTQSDNRTDIYAIGMLMKFKLTKNTTDKKSKIRGRLGKIIVVPKKWTNNTGGYYNNITVQFVMEVS